MLEWLYVFLKFCLVNINYKFVKYDKCINVFLFIKILVGLKDILVCVLIYKNDIKYFSWKYIIMWDFYVKVNSCYLNDVYCLKYIIYIKLLIV